MITPDISKRYEHVGLGVPVGTEAETLHEVSTSTQDSLKSFQNIQSGQVISWATKPPFPVGTHMKNFWQSLGFHIKEGVEWVRP